MSSFNPVASAVKRSFEAPDPWSEGSPVVGWQLLTYHILPDDRTLVLGIQVKRGERYRILPLALQPLVENGTIPAEKLPEILYRIERKLWTEDYPPRQNFWHTGVATIIVSTPLLYLGYETWGSDPLFPKLVTGLGGFLAALGLGFSFIGHVIRMREKWIVARALKV